MISSPKPRIAQKAMRSFYKAKYKEISESIENIGFRYVNIIGGLYAESLKNYSEAQALQTRQVTSEGYNMEI